MNHSFSIEFTDEAKDDLLRLFQYLLDHADLERAEKALASVKSSISI